MTTPATLALALSADAYVSGAFHRAYEDDAAVTGRRMPVRIMYGDGATARLVVALADGDAARSIVALAEADTVLIARYRRARARQRSLLRALVGAAR